MTRRPPWAAARLAVSMFTIIPVPSSADQPADDAPLDEGLASRAVRWLPAVGLLLATPAAVLMLIVGASGTDGGVFRRLLGAVLAIALLGLLTGGLHLDGLADTVDGLASRRPRDQALEIMRRGDTGPLGVAALVFAVLLQVTALAALAAAGERQAVAGLLLGAATARTAVVVATGPAFPAARPGGFGALVAGRTSPRAGLLAASALVVAAVAAGLLLGGAALAVRLPAAATAGLLTGLAVARGARSRLGGLTGDVFGAIVEISMAATLVALVVGGLQAAGPALLVADGLGARPRHSDVSLVVNVNIGARDHAGMFYCTRAVSAVPRSSVAAHQGTSSCRRHFQPLRCRIAMRSVRAQFVMIGAAVASAAAGVATNRIQGAWWIQGAWGFCAVAFLAIAGTLASAATEKNPWRGRKARGVLAPPVGRLPRIVRGRDELVSQILTLAKAPDGRVHILTGMGGMGKSTVALKVAAVAMSKGLRVWWVSATDDVTMESSLLGLAESLGAEAGQIEAVKASRAAACDVLWEVLEETSGWLLLIDNADDVRQLSISGRQSHDGNGWLRGSRNGLVLITTRDSEVRHWPYDASLHQVGPLTAEEGGQALRDLAPEGGDDADARDLSVCLDGLPLAIYHVGSQLASPFSLIQTFAACQEVFGSSSPTADYRQSVAATWQLSLSQLAETGVPQARSLVGILAWFAGGVPIRLNEVAFDVLGEVTPGVREGLSALNSVGLIGRREGQGVAVVLHPLVAVTMRDQAGSAAASTAVRLLYEETRNLAPSERTAWLTWPLWLPHLDEFLGHAYELLDKQALELLGEAAAGAANGLLWGGSYARSREVARAGINALERVGIEHPLVLSLRNIEACGYEFSGQSDIAAERLRDVLRARERVLGADEPFTLNTLHCLARVLAKQGEFTESERCFHRVITWRERVLGPRHEDTLNSRRTLAHTFVLQGRCAEALQLYQETLGEHEQVLGPDHMHTLNVRVEIAKLIAAQGDLSSGEVLLRQVSESDRRALGADHPDTLMAQYELAMLLATRGRRKPALRLLRDVLSAQKRILGEGHPDVLATTQATDSLESSGVGLK